MKPVLWLIVVLFVAVALIAGGAMDLDWMIVAYKFDMWNGSNGVWEFCPFLKVGWWLAYFISVMRLAVGCVLLGVVVGALWFRYGRGDSS